MKIIDAYVTFYAAKGKHLKDRDDFVANLSRRGARITKGVKVPVDHALAADEVAAAASEER